MDQDQGMVTPPSVKFAATLVVSVLAFALVLIAPEELDPSASSATVRAVQAR